MRSFTYTIHIDRSPEKVWAYMMDLDKAPRWRNLVRNVEVATPGPVGVGSQLKITFDLQGRQKTAYEISACLVGSEMCIRDSSRTDARS